MIRGWLLACAIAIAGVCLAGYRAGTRALHHDEAASLRTSELTWDELARPGQFAAAATLPNQAGPSANTTSEIQNRWLFAVTLKLWTQAFGTSVSALRAYGILCHALFALALYLFLLELLREAPPGAHPRREAVALLALGFASLDALAIHQAGQIRNYPLCTMLLALTAWAMLRAARRDRWADWLQVAGFGAAAFYSYNTALFVLAGMWVWFGARRLLRVEATAEPAVARSRHAPWITAAIAMAAAVAPGLLQLAAQRDAHGAAGWWMPPLTWSRLFEHAPSFVFGDSLFLRNSPVMGAAILGGFAIALYRTWRVGFRFPPIVGLVPFLALIAMSLTGPNVVIPRYFLILAPFLWICLAIAVLTIPWTTARRAALALAIVIVGGFTARSVVTWDRQSAGGSREIAAWIERTADRDATVIVSPWLYLSVKYYLPDRDVRVYSRADIGIPFYMSAPLLGARDRVTSLADLTREPPAARQIAYVHVGINDPPIDPIALPPGWAVERRQVIDSPWVESEVVLARAP